MMTLKPSDAIVTRWTVKKLAQQNPNVTEIDLSDSWVVSASAMHELIVSFPRAVITGLTGYKKEIYDSVITTINSDEYKRNQGNAK